MRIKIGVKIGIVFFILFSEVLTIAFILNSVKDKCERYMDENASARKDMELIEHLRLSLAQVVMPANDYLIIGGDPNERNNFTVLSRRVEELIQKLGDSTLLNSGKKAQCIASLNEKYQDLKGMALKIFAIPNPYGNPEAGGMMEEIDRISDVIVSEVDEFHDFIYERIDAIEMDWRRSKNIFILIVFGDIALGLFIIVSGLFFLERAVSRPIMLLRGAFSKVSQGDLNINVKISSNDEIGDLNISFNQMVDALKQLHRQLVDKSYVESLISGMADILIVIAPDCRIKTVNRAVLELLGYSEDELIGYPAEKIFSGIKDAENEIENMLNEIAGGALIVANDLKILLANKALLEMLGLEKNDVVGQFCYKVLHGRKNMCEPFYKACPMYKDGKEAEACVETHTHIDKQGQEMRVNVTAAPILDSRGEVVAYLHLVGEIASQSDREISHMLTNRIKMYVEKIESTHIFCALGIRRIIDIGMIRDAEMELTAKGGVKIPVSFSVSPIFERSRGDAAGGREVIGVVGIARDMRPMKKLIADLEIAKSALQEWSQALERKVEERTKELEKSQEATLNILSDLIETRDNLEKYTKDLEDALSVKSKFTSTVSHELRTPLTAIKEGIGIVLDEAAGNINSEQKEFLGIAKRNVDRLARLIKAVLDFQKLDSGKTEFIMEEGDINSVIREAGETISGLAKEKKLDLVIKPGEKIPVLKFDKDKIIQVLMNLTDNAVKFTEKGSIIISAAAYADYVLVSVADTGIGFKEEDISRLFHSFEQITKDKEKRAQGTGLGLAISKSIIDAHKGKIWAESEYGRGSTFYFTLPIKP